MRGARASRLGRGRPGLDPVVHLARPQCQAGDLQGAPEAAPAIPLPVPATALLAVLAIPTLVFGIWWSPLAALAAKAAGIAG